MELLIKKENFLLNFFRKNKKFNQIVFNKLNLNSKKVDLNEIISKNENQIL